MNNISETSVIKMLISRQLSMLTKEASVNDFFLVVMAILIVFMQCGFALLEAGSVRSKNVTNILIKNILDSFVGGLGFYVIGYALAYGEPGNQFCGTNFFALSYLSPGKYSHVLFQFAFAATSATIVSGAVAERIEFSAYLIYTCVMTAFIYPIVAHWAWTPNGWLRSGFSLILADQSKLAVSLQDFAGSGVVHLVGGSAAFVAAFILGPRLGRFTPDGQSTEIRGHSIPMVALGGFILFFGFFAFNGGSQGSITHRNDGKIVALAMINTMLCGGTAACTTMIIARLMGRTWSLLQTINGALAGMVAICAGCNVFFPWASLVTGIIASFSYMFWSWFMVYLKIDDPLDAVAVHFGGGSWGLLAVPFFHQQKGLVIEFSRQGGMDLVWQVVALLAISAWSSFITFVLFSAMKHLKMLRVCEEYEIKGLDIPKHSEMAYPLNAYGHGWLTDAIPELSVSGIQFVKKLLNKKLLRTNSNAVDDYLE